MSRYRQQKPFIHDLFIDGDPEQPDLNAFHPNVVGNSAYAKAIFAAIRSAWSDHNEKVA